MGTAHIVVSNLLKTAFLFLLLIFSSCVTSNLQTASLKGLENKSVAHLAKDDYQTRATLRPYFFNNKQKKLRLNTGTHTQVNSDGFYELEPTEAEDILVERKNVNVYEFEGKNLFHTVPANSFGFDFEYTESGKVITVGLQYGQMSGQDFLNGLVGISFFHEKVFRIGMNIYFQKTTYDAVVMHVENHYSNNRREVEIGRVKGRESFIDTDFYLNWRSYFQQYIFIDVFMEGTMGTQSLIDVNHSAKNLVGTTANMKYNDDYFSFTFGAFKDLTDDVRIIAGYKMNFHDEEYSNLRIRTDSYFIQFDYDLLLNSQ